MTVLWLKVCILAQKSNPVPGTYSSWLLPLKERENSKAPCLWEGRQRQNHMERNFSFADEIADLLVIAVIC